MAQTISSRLVAGLGLVALLGPAPLPAQLVLASRETGSPGRARCESQAAVVRLRLEHPLGAAAAASVCLGDGAMRWVPTRPMDPAERQGWDRASAELGRSFDPACRIAAALLRDTERSGRVSVWRAVDTAGGILYVGATYVAPDSALLAVQFWAPALRRSTDWVIGALAHEAFHALHPEAGEAAAVAFGDRCRETARLPAVLARSDGPPSPPVFQSGSDATKR